MPIDPLIAAAAIQAGSAIFNYAQTGKMNKKMRGYNTQMYDRQRKDALSDWTRQTEYNSPTSQMARLRAAGLNPNFVYGEGGALQPSPAIRSTEGKPWTPHAPQIDTSQVGESISRIYDIKSTEAQTDNYKAVNTNLVKQGLLYDAQTLATYAGTEKSAEELGALKRELAHRSVMDPISQQFAEGSVRKQEADIDYTRTAEQNAILQTSTNVKEAISRMSIAAQNATKIPHEIEEIVARTKSILASTELQIFETMMKKNNIYPGDEAWQRALQSFWKKIMDKDRNYKYEFPKRR